MFGLIIKKKIHFSRCFLLLECAMRLCVKGPRYLTAQDIILPSSVEIVDNTQNITNLTKTINLGIELQIKRNSRYYIKRQITS